MKKKLHDLDSGKGSVLLILGIVLFLAILIQLVRADVFLDQREVQTVAKRVPSAGTLIDYAKLQNMNRQQIAVVFSSTNRDSVTIKDNMKQTFKDMQLSVDVIDTTRDELRIQPYSAVIYTLNQITPAFSEQIESYVSGGGRVWFSTILEKDDAYFNIYRKLGIYDVGNYFNTTGISFMTDLMLGTKGKTFNHESIENLMLSVKLDERATVHATSSNGIPMLWEVPYGDGGFVVFNGTMLGEKLHRGMVARATALLSDTFAYPVINANVMYIDDFPAPIASGIDANIHAQYKRSIGRFIKEIWWPDMMKLAAQYNLRYTAVAIQSYDNDVKPPFEDGKYADEGDLIKYGRDLLKSGGEIGIHGYNHQSLTRDQRIAKALDYRAWPDKQAMRASVDEVKKFINKAYPNMEVYTYVPPSNSLSEEGRQALLEAWPEMRVIASVFAMDSTGISYVQEFGVGEDGVVNMPRFTSGFVISDSIEWVTANSANYVGMMSHFIHPDDILDSKRNQSMNWEQLYKSFEKLLRYQSDSFSWIVPHTSVEAAEKTRGWSQSQLYLDYRPNGIEGHIQSFHGPMDILVRSDRPIAKATNCEYKALGETDYLVTVTKPQFQLQWGGAAR